MNYKEKISAPEYDFLKTHESLGKNISLIALGGSHAYGMNNEQSDLDIRGFALNSKKEILLGKDFESFVDNKTDTTIYSIKKMFHFLSMANPNTIEILGCLPEHYLYLDNIGEKVLKNKDIFLSQKAFSSFKGYASQQLYRLEAALTRDKYEQEKKEKHILSSCLRSMMTMGERYTNFEYGSIKLYIDKARNEELTTEIYTDVSLKGYPLRDFKNIFMDLNNILCDYGKMNKRNHKKDDNHLNKHAAHLVRLQLMAYDLIKDGKIITFRKKDHDLLMAIRNGFFQTEEGLFKQEFYDIVNENEEKIDIAFKTTCLPKLPDYNKIELLLCEINENIIKS